MSESRYY